MTDPYDQMSSSLQAPASGAFRVVPDDGAELPHISRALYVGQGGTLLAEMHWGGVVTFHNVGDGELLPLRVRKVLAASTASEIIGLF